MRHGGKTGVGIVIQTTEKNGCLPMACKQKEAKRPQGRARDEGDHYWPAEKDCSDVLLMVKSSSVGEIMSPACRKEGSFKEGKTGRGRNSWTPECGENDNSCTTSLPVCQPNRGYYSP